MAKEKKQKKGGPYYVVDDDSIKKVYELAKKGLKRRTIIKALPFTIETFYNYERAARDAKGKKWEELTERGTISFTVVSRFSERSIGIS